MVPDNMIPEIGKDSVMSCKPWHSSDPVRTEALYYSHLPPYEVLFQKILLKNQLCILGSEVTAEWGSRKFWVNEDGTPNFDYLREQFGDSEAPVSNCNAEEFCSHPKTEMKVKDFLTYWQKYKANGHPTDEECLYLKDWHFRRDFPFHDAYTTPAFLSSDWLNEFWDTRNDEADQDDYRFVYMGPKNSWTPFHADVLRSYSWSANICGRKKWIFYPPGAEERLMDKHGQLIFDLGNPDLKDPQKYPQASAATNSSITVIQNPGEIIFVPSGWHHQVFNIEDTISINHNWMNGCGAHLSWSFIKSRLVSVQQEISDCHGMDGWENQCQLILKADSGIDYAGFFRFMAMIAEHRISALQSFIAEHLPLTKSKCDITSGQQEDVRSSKQTADRCDKPGAQPGDEPNVNLPEGFPSRCLCLVGSGYRSGKHSKTFACNSFSRSSCGTNILTQADIASLPHWALCGPNLAVFDLLRVKDILLDMQDQPQFTTTCEEFCVELERLIEQIQQIVISWNS